MHKLSNIHIHWYPLRDEDGMHARQYKKLVIEVGVDKAEKRKA